MIEVDPFRASETIVLGEVRSIEAQELPKQGPCAAVTIAVQSCLKGECLGEFVTTYMMATPTADSREDEFPEVGHQYIFCLRSLRSAPGLVWGGYASDRYEVRSGFVVESGLTVDDTLDAIRTSIATRSPEVLMRSCDLVVAGRVTAYVDTFTAPPDVGNEFSRDGVRRMRAGYIDPIACNLVELSIDRVLKGPLDLGATLEVVLPYHVGRGPDVPRFAEGQDVVVFACMADQGYWKPCAGTDSRLIVREDGSVGEYASLAELAARAPN